MKALLLVVSLPIALLLAGGCSGGDDTELVGGDTSGSDQSQPPATYANTPADVVRKMLEGIERKDGNQYLDAIDPNMRDRPGFGFAAALLGSIASFFGVDYDATNVSFRGMTYEEAANNGMIAQVAVRGRIRDLNLFQESSFNDLIGARQIDGTWYVTELSEAEVGQLRPEQVPTALTKTFEGPQQCIVFHYPDDWTPTTEKFESAHGLEYCPGAEHYSGTRVTTTCEPGASEYPYSGPKPAIIGDPIFIGNHEGSVLYRDDSNDPGADVYFLPKRCKDDRDTLSQLLPYPEYGWLEHEVGDPEEATTAGWPSICAEGVGEIESGDAGVKTLRYRACLVSVQSDTYALIGYGLESDWETWVKRLIENIFESTEIHPISAD